MSAHAPTAQFNVHEAKTHLSQLLERVAAGEEIVISRAGKPMARLVPVRHPALPRKPGAWRGRVRIHDDFDELSPSIMRAFTGEES